MHSASAGLLLLSGLLALTPAPSAGQTAPSPMPTPAPPIVLKDGLSYTDIVAGTGAVPKKGDTIVVHYTGWLTDGTKFDSSRDRQRPFTFVLGNGTVIKGWDEGVATMHVGGLRRLVVPPELGYGAKGQGEKIPGNATLVFVVELLDIR